MDITSYRWRLQNNTRYRCDCVLILDTVGAYGILLDKLGVGISGIDSLRFGVGSNGVDAIRMSEGR